MLATLRPHLIVPLLTVVQFRLVSVAKLARLPVGIAEANGKGCEDGTDKGEYGEAFYRHDVSLHESGTMPEHHN